jgi:hypothetical protein
VRATRHGVPQELMDSAFDIYKKCDTICLFHVPMKSCTSDPLTVSMPTELYQCQAICAVQSC